MSPVLLNPLLLAPAAPAGFAALVASLSPVWWHRLSPPPGAMVDGSGNGRDGAYESVTAATGLVTGDSDSAKTFGSGSRAVVPYASWMTCTTGLTVSAVITPSAVVGGTTYGIVSRYAHDFSNSQFFLRLDGNKSALYIFSGGGFAAALGSTSLVAGTTYDVAATWEA